MSLVELLPLVQALPREDRVRLVHLLVDELSQAQKAQQLEPNAAYPVWSPYDAYEAADALRRVLEAERAKP